MRFGILVFPGTWSETDCYYQVKDILGQDAEYVWHQETNLDGFDSVILPGGFPQLEQRIGQHGFKTLPVPLSEFQKADGGVTCLSLLINEV